MHRRTPRLIASLVCALAFSGAAAQSASASAFGIQYWGAFTANIGGQNIGIPSGQLAHQIDGSGRYVSKDAANFMSAANICNWRIDFRYSDVNGYVYERNRGGVHYSCARYGERFTYPRVNKRYGKSCAELYTNGAFVARQCHSITG